MELGNDDGAPGVLTSGCDLYITEDLRLGHLVETCGKDILFLISTWHQTWSEPRRNWAVGI